MTPEQKIQQIDGAIFILSTGNRCQIQIVAQKFEAGEGRLVINVRYNEPLTEEEHEELNYGLEALLTDHDFHNVENQSVGFGSRGLRVGQQFVANGRVSDPNDN
jgi:hypothetical protein